MNIIRYSSPAGVMSSLRKEVDRLFDTAFYSDKNDPSQSLSAQWRPCVDLKESADKFTVYADLPGIDPEEIKISLDNNILTIKGQRNLESESGNENFHYVERYSGVFCRQFTLPQNVDNQKIKASFKKGVLEVNIPKTEKATTKYIEIKAED